jgi:predicted nuclease of restriction endonuclease-like (RecB) superfamily
VYEIKPERRGKDSFVVQNLHLKHINIEDHIKRFPDDFMFELTKEEYATLRCKNSTIYAAVSFLVV